VPRLSHQCPIFVVVAEVVVNADVVVVLIVVVVIDVFVVVVVDVGAEVVVEVVVGVPQEDKTSDITMIPVSNTRMAPFFIQTSFLIYDFSR
jgi:hypothetical protein